MYKKWLRGIVVVGLTIAVSIGPYKIDNYNEYVKSKLVVSDEENLNLWENGQIIYDGHRYQYKNDIKTYLLMGIDSMDEVLPKAGGVNGGQSDALFLLVVDDDEEKWSLISINRNTMTKISVYDDNGEYLWDIYGQICVQHGFGDGMEQSCERTVRTLSKTLFNLPIDGFFYINMGALPMFNDALSGVTVTAMDTIDIPEENIHIEEGEKVTLRGMQAWGYLVWRDETQSNSATRRLERQEQYIKMAYAKIKESSIEDKIDLIKNVLDIVQAYTVIDMPVVQTGYKILKYDKILDMLIDIYYKKIE